MPVAFQQSTLPIVRLDAARRPGRCVAKRTIAEAGILFPILYISHEVTHLLKINPINSQKGRCCRPGVQKNGYAVARGACFSEYASS